MGTRLPTPPANSAGSRANSDRAVDDEVIAEEPGKALPRNLRRRGYPDDYLDLITEGKRLIEQNEKLIRLVEEADATTLKWQVLVAQVVMRDGGEIILDDTPLSRLPEQLELSHDPSLGRTTVRAVFGKG